MGAEDEPRLEKVKHLHSDPKSKSQGAQRRHIWAHKSVSGSSVVAVRSQFPIGTDARA